MIIISYCGGLGNQMYQYALQIALKKMYPQQKFKADLTHYNLLNEHNGFELREYFQFDTEEAKRKEIRRVYNGLIPTHLCTYLPYKIKKIIAHNFQYKILKINNMFFKDKSMSTISDNLDNNLNEAVFNLDEGDWYVKGMWQNISYFDSYRKDIIESFRLKVNVNDKDKDIINLLENGKAIAVHIRGGDFLTTKFNLCDENYYSKALDIIGVDLPIVVLTDDIDYARNMLRGKNVQEIISHHPSQSIIDMFILSKARYLIISNSTFSFWGAYLNQTEHIKVVYPQFLTYDNRYKTYREFIGRSKWVAIDNSK